MLKKADGGNDVTGSLPEEIDILRIVADNPAISQRKISERTGISLGQVNFLIKKCVRKGLIKIEGQTAKSIRYNITPKGLAEKAEKTAEYIKISCAAVLKLTEAMREVARHQQEQGKQLYITGEKDELMEIAKLALPPECFEKKDGADVVEINIRELLDLQHIAEG